VVWRVESKWRVWTFHRSFDEDSRLIPLPLLVAAAANGYLIDDLSRLRIPPHAVLDRHSISPKIQAKLFRR